VEDILSVAKLLTTRERGGKGRVVDRLHDALSLSSCQPKRLATHRKLIILPFSSRDFRLLPRTNHETSNASGTSSRSKLLVMLLLLLLRLFHRHWHRSSTMSMVALLSRSHRRDSSFNDARPRDRSRGIDGRKKNGSDATVLGVVGEELFPVWDALRRKNKLTSGLIRRMRRVRGRRRRGQRRRETMRATNLELLLRQTS